MALLPTRLGPRLCQLPEKSIPCPRAPRCLTSPVHGPTLAPRSARKEEAEQLERERAMAREALDAERQAVKQSLEATRKVGRT